MLAAPRRSAHPSIHPSRSAAEEAAGRGLSVVVVDPRPNAVWPNNYGVWVDEFEAMGLADCVDTTWKRAKVQFTEGEEAVCLDRQYGRVDRRRLKKRLLDGCVRSGVLFHAAKARGVSHTDGWRSCLQCDDGSELFGCAVLDGTGHSRALVEFEGEFDPGYQGAYGVMIEVEKGHPFELDTMFFMDWRDDHLEDDPDMLARNASLPTFLYTMPFSETRIFVEETSLVARPAVPFPELKRRLAKRLDKLGVVVKEVIEEEYCLIPMGGVLPRMPQRVLGLGGTGGMVHPATGFMIARTLGAAPLLVDGLERELARARREAAAALPTGTPREEVLARVDMGEVTARVWEGVWPAWRLQQREFFNTGMDILLRLGIDSTRSFFAAFFKTSTYNWQGFLSYRLTLVELMGFGIEFFAVGDWRMRRFTTVSALPGLVTLIQKLLTSGFSRQVGITEGADNGVRWKRGEGGNFSAEMRNSLADKEKELPRMTADERP